MFYIGYIFNVDAENHSVNIHSGMHGIYKQSQPKYFSTLAEPSYINGFTTVPFPCNISNTFVLLSLFCATQMKTIVLFLFIEYLHYSQKKKHFQECR